MLQALAQRGRKRKTCTCLSHDIYGICPCICREACSAMRRRYSARIAASDTLGRPFCLHFFKYCSSVSTAPLDALNTAACNCRCHHSSCTLPNTSRYSSYVKSIKRFFANRSSGGVSGDRLRTIAPFASPRGADAGGAAALRRCELRKPPLRASGGGPAGGAARIGAAAAPRGEARCCRTPADAMLWRSAQARAMSSGLGTRCCCAMWFMRASASRPAPCNRKTT